METMADRDRIVEHVKERYKQWQYVEQLYHPEYNGMDEEAEARTAQGTYDGAHSLAVMLLGEGAAFTDEECLAELREELRARIAEREKELEGHTVTRYERALSDEEKQSYFERIHLESDLDNDRRVLENLTEED